MVSKLRDFCAAVLKTVRDCWESVMSRRISARRPKDRNEAALSVIADKDWSQSGPELPERRQRSRLSLRANSHESTSSLRTQCLSLLLGFSLKARRSGMRTPQIRSEGALIVVFEHGACDDTPHPVDAKDTKIATSGAP
jgi:hypothetical protein